MSDTEWLRSFLAVYRAGSVTDAAYHRGISQPAVSQHLAALERAVGSRLFVRKPGGVEPTSQGRDLYGLGLPSGRGVGVVPAREGHDAHHSVAWSNGSQPASAASAR